MKVKNSIQGEQLVTRVAPRILISYYRATMEIEEYNLVSRLATDLQSIGIDVLIDEIHNTNVSPLLQLSSYDWILLVQTKDTANFAWIKQRLANALAQERRQPFQNIGYVLVATPHSQATLPDADIPITFDASIDYSRAFAAIVLTLYPNNQVSFHGIEHGTAPAPSAPAGPLAGVITSLPFRSPHLVGSRQVLYVVFSLLTVLILLAVIIIHSFVPSSIKKTPAIRSTAIRTTTSNRHTRPAAMIATATSPQAILYSQVTSRTPVINDSLQNQSGNLWNVMQQQGVSCAFANGSYHVSILPPAQLSRRHACLAQEPIFTNLAMQVDMKLLQGDVGGMIFRANGLNSYSWFSLDAHGCYRLVLLTPGNQPQILSNDQQSCLPINMQNTNQLTVLAQGSNIYLYIDGKFINQFPDPSLIRGGIGLIAIARTHSTDVAFTHLKVWQVA